MPLGQDSESGFIEISENGEIDLVDFSIPKKVETGDCCYPDKKNDDSDIKKILDCLKKY